MGNGCLGIPKIEGFYCKFSYSQKLTVTQNMDQGPAQKAKFVGNYELSKFLPFRLLEKRVKDLNVFF